jgi:hypothetical protein
MVYGHFHAISLTKESYLELVCLDFKQNELGFWLFKKQTFEFLAHIWQGCAHLHFQQLWQLWFSGLPQKGISHFISVREGQTRDFF